MSLFFTEYVRLLESGAAPKAADCQVFSAAWNKLRDALKAELGKRSQWNAAPSYLGLQGYANWCDEALDELVADCFSFVFIERLPSLAAQLKVRENIEGLVFLSLRNFLYDTQKKYDPLGFRVFEVLRTAVRRAMDEEKLWPSPGDSTTEKDDETLPFRPRISNDTVLLTHVDAVAKECCRTHLDEIVKEWAHELLPGLITSRGGHKQVVVDTLAASLARLRQQGVEAFRFKDLATPLKSAVRAYWNSELHEEELGFEEGAGEIAVLVPVARPDPGPEERDSFRKLLACVEAKLESYEEPRRRELQQVWMVLRSAAAGDIKVPSRRRLAERLGITRHRAHILCRTLARRIEECRARFRHTTPY